VLNFDNNNIKTNATSIEFNFTLPNNELIKVNLSIELMRQKAKIELIEVVDLSYENETVKTGLVDARISIELKTPSHGNT